MAVDLGTDIACTFGLGKVFVLASGNQNLANALVRRLRTRRGGLFYDPNYGYSLTALLSSGATVAYINAQGPAIEAECCKDERVQSAAAVLNYVAPSTLNITLTITTANGPFDLVLSADALTVTLLQVS